MDMVQSAQLEPSLCVSIATEMYRPLFTVSVLPVVCRWWMRSWIIVWSWLNCCHRTSVIDITSVWSGWSSYLSWWKLALRSFTTRSATCSNYCMMCWMIVVLGFRNALSTVSAEHMHICNILYVKKIMLLVTAVCRLCITWDLQDTAEYEHLYHITYTNKLFDDAVLYLWEL